MVTFPNCKINIGLNITEKRKDGYHNIETVFYPIQWCDVLECITTKESITSLSISGIDVPIEDNLVTKAYSLLKKDFELPNIQILLHKNIPSGAGLGGGSSDAAFMIKLLNNYFKLGLNNTQMQQYASILGSDCAFFIENKPLYAFNKGNEFEEINLDLSNYYIVIVKPNIHVSTAEAYAGVTPSKSELDLRKTIQLPVNEWKNIIKNDFENSIFKKHPSLNEIKQYFYSKGALYASMSGSGSSIYGIFNSEIDLKQDFQNLDYFGALLNK